MFFKKSNSALEELLETVSDPSRKSIINQSINPQRIALAWLTDTGLKFTIADVLTLSEQLKDRLP